MGTHVGEPKKLPIRTSDVKRFMNRAAAIAALSIFGAPANADIFTWKYVDTPEGLMKLSSSVLAVDGAGVNAEPFANLSNRDLTQAYLNGADLNHANLDSATLASAEVSTANLSYANLSGARLSYMTAKSTNFSHANLAFAILWDNDLSGATFANSILYVANFGSVSSLNAADLSGANLRYSLLAASNALNTNFSNADLSYVDFNVGTYTGAFFAGAKIKGASFAKPTSGVGVLNPFTINASQIYSTASYQDHDLGAVDFTRRDLTGWDFSNQNLRRASFSLATLNDASFVNADLSFATIAFSSNNGANFAGANLTGAAIGGGSSINFSGAISRQPGSGVIQISLDRISPTLLSARHRLAAPTFPTLLRITSISGAQAFREQISQARCFQTPNST